MNVCNLFVWKLWFYTDNIAILATCMMTPWLFVELFMSTSNVQSVHYLNWLYPDSTLCHVSYPCLVSTPSHPSMSTHMSCHLICLCPVNTVHNVCTPFTVRSMPCCFSVLSLHNTIFPAHVQSESHLIFPFPVNAPSLLAICSQYTMTLSHPPMFSRYIRHAHIKSVHYMYLSYPHPFRTLS